ncbi:MULTISPECIES: alanine/glycine:cation symporter family protein [unclassified Paracoccus (in: a-proteobacteria)]|uniref:alanine/glycine:cation symporter family protein n=1 Tax=unclassified Paracoccus (in: a-proteobacteria) TaxID=2688777 RepID=UPI0012B1AD51|nr:MULTISPECIES: alanine/glycine:cation symporter family protein [unclassified Paracoccus (in: a-proteobacteria)]UXU76018.1 alanine:cation symporter family protein [Paracoccus sp. SMMA_5]UXU81928.1 alanine:cation symporter family protein [Paracoccus sp. SMMA_5_TC]
MTAIIDFLNTIFWGYVLIYGLLAVGIYFTIRLGFIQILHFREMIRCVLGSDSQDRNGISPFQALTVSLASRVGTGNIAGVAVAITLGGPGAVFWMWMVALVGMATAYAESTLAQLYKENGPGGMYRGGPAYYIQKGLGQGWLAGIFAVALIIAFGLIFNAVQSNSIAEAMAGAFGVEKWITGLAIALLTAVIIFGGIPSIARVAEFVVPFMAGAYLLAAAWVLVTNITEVPAVLGHIVASAFGWTEAAGGVVGGMTAAMLNGVKRGLFSNEAGMGSAPNIAAVATPDPHHPSSQGFVQALGVFIDTILVCTATAVMILLSGAIPSAELTGVALTQAALGEHFGSFGQNFVAIAIFFFAFTSIIGNYAYAENAIVFLGHGSSGPVVALRVAVMGMVVWGAIQTVQTVFDFADASMGLMATINLIAIVLLSGTIAHVTRDYLRQRADGRNPTFHIDDHPGIAPGVSRTIWK